MVIVFSGIALSTAHAASAQVTVDPCTINSAGTYYVERDPVDGDWNCGASGFGHPDATMVIADSNDNIVRITTEGPVELKSITYDKTRTDLPRLDIIGENKCGAAKWCPHGPSSVDIGSVTLDGTSDISCGGTGYGGGEIRLWWVRGDVNIGSFSANGGDAGDCSSVECSTFCSGEPNGPGYGGNGGVIEIRSADDSINPGSKEINIGEVLMNGGDSFGNRAGSGGEVNIRLNTDYKHLGIEDTTGDVFNTNDIIMEGGKFKGTRGRPNGPGGIVRVTADSMNANNIMLNGTGGSDGSAFSLTSVNRSVIKGMLASHTIYTLRAGEMAIGCVYMHQPSYWGGDQSSTYSAFYVPWGYMLDIGCGIIADPIGGGGAECGEGTEEVDGECVPAEQQTTLDFHGRAIFKGAGPVYGGTAEFWVSNEASDTIWGTSTAPAVTVNFDGGLFNKLLGETSEGDPQLNLVLGDDYILFVRVCEAVAGCEQFELPFEA